MQRPLHSPVHHGIPIRSNMKVDATECPSAGASQQKWGVHSNPLCATVEMVPEDIMMLRGMSLSQSALLTCHPRTRKRD